MWLQTRQHIADLTVAMQPCSPRTEKNQTGGQLRAHHSLIAKTLTELIHILDAVRAGLDMHPCIKATFHTVRKVFKKKKCNAK